MKRHLKGILIAVPVLILALTLSVVLVFCGEKDIVIASQDLPFSGNVLYGGEEEYLELSRIAAVDFKDQLNDLSFANVFSAYPTDSIGEVENEIIFGSSSRAASVKANDLLKSKNAYESDDFYWSFCYQDGKLAIVANASLAYELAVRQLLEVYITDGALVVPSNLLFYNSFCML